MKILLIGNPISSGGHAGRRIQALSSLLETRGHEVKTYLTQYAGDGKDHIETLSQDMDRTVVVGGDGTLNEIINGLPPSSDCPILHYPTGNANILAKDLKLPKRPEDVADLLENGRIVNADVGVMNGNRFVMVCGMGFDARVTEELKKVRTGKVSNFSYVRPFLRAMKTPSTSPLRVIIDDGTIEASGAAVLVANVRNYAGFCNMAHDAGILTQTLDVIIFPKENFTAIMTYLAYSVISRVTRIKGVKYIKAHKNIHIRAGQPIPVELDGDFAERHQEVMINLQPDTLPLIVPNDFNG